MADYSATPLKKLQAVGWITVLFVLERLPMLWANAPYLSQYEDRSIYGAYQIVNTGHLSVGAPLTPVIGFASFYRDFPGTPIFWATTSELTALPVLSFAIAPVFSLLAAIFFYLLTVRISKAHWPSLITAIMFTAVPFQFGYAISSFVYTYLVLIAALFCLFQIGR